MHAALAAAEGEEVDKDVGFEDECVVIGQTDVRKGYDRNCLHHDLELLTNPVLPPSRVPGDRRHGGLHRAVRGAQPQSREPLAGEAAGAADSRQTPPRGRIRPRSKVAELCGREHISRQRKII